jgi:hypothetical protein
MENLQALENKLDKLRTKWDEVAFGTEFQGEMKFEIMGTIESEIFLTKLAVAKMKEVLK